MAQHKTSRRRVPSRARKLEAQAFRDAVRDILQQDGVFSLADEAQPDTVYHFDGVTWQREQLPRPRRARRVAHVEAVHATGTSG